MENSDFSDNGKKNGNSEEIRRECERIIYRIRMKKSDANDSEIHSLYAALKTLNLCELNGVYDKAGIIGAAKGNLSAFVQKFVSDTSELFLKMGKRIELYCVYDEPLIFYPRYIEAFLFRCLSEITDACANAFVSVFRVGKNAVISVSCGIGSTTLFPKISVPLGIAELHSGNIFAAAGSGSFTVYFLLPNINGVYPEKFVECEPFFSKLCRIPVLK